MTPVPEGFQLSVAPSNGAPQRLVVLTHLESHSDHRDRINTNSARSRQKFVRDAAGRLSLEDADLDWLHAELTRQADDADEEAEKDAEKACQTEQSRKSQATLLVELAEDAELFHDADTEAYARYLGGSKAGEHYEVARVRSRMFRRWLTRRFFLVHGKVPGSQAVQEAIGVIEGKAHYEGQQRDVHVRVAEHGDRIYIDLCDAAWRAIEITETGWRVVSEPPVMFRRAKAMLPLPIPEHGGSAGELLRFANVPGDQWPLVLAWLVAALRPVGPYPLLVVHGEQGSAKSTLCELLRLLVDPNTAPLRSEPREPRDLMIAAMNGQVVAIDNVSHLPVWLSDSLCRLATGGGFSTRTLYSDDEETIFSAQRPVILNGIEDIATRSDLLDRSILINLPTIEERQRRPLRALMDEFRRLQPRILGGLLDGISAGLRNLPATHLDCLPRMADFALWASACCEGLGLRPGDFLASYEGNRDSANETAIDASPVGKEVMSFAHDVREWSGTATELLKELNGRADEATKRLRSWPSTPRSVSGILRRLAPNVRAAGVDLDFADQGRGRDKRKCVVIRDRRSRDETVPTCPTVPNAGFSPSHGVGGAANGASGVALGSQSDVDVSPTAARVGSHGAGGDASSHPDPGREVHTL